MIGVNAALAAVAFAVQPAFDDFATARPILDLTPAHLAPALFWRPIEKLHLAAVGALPALFPHYLHLVAVVAHLAVLGALWRLLPRAGRLPALAFFSCSPAIVGPLWSVDGAIAVASAACGLWGLVLLESRPRAGWWLAMALLAALHKETGLSWFVCLPLLQWIRAGERSLLVRQGAIGALGILAYLALRALPAGPAFVAAEGRYGLEFDPLAAAMLFAFYVVGSLLPLDPIAHVLGPRLWLWLTVLAGLPLWIAALRRLWRTRWLAGGLAVAAATAAPVLSIGHISEMYLYPCVAVLALAIGRARVSLTPLLVFCLVGLAVDAHKGRPMIAAGHAAREIGRELAEQWSGPPPEVVCHLDPKATERSYSVFLGSPGKASAWGRSVDREWGFRVRSFELRSSPADCPAESEALIRVTPSGEAEIIPTR